MNPKYSAAARRFAEVFIACGAGDAAIQAGNEYSQLGTYDSHHLVGALVIAFVMAVGKYLATPSGE